MSILDLWKSLTFSARDAFLRVSEERDYWKKQAEDLIEGKCLGVIPGTFIACGESFKGDQAQYCSQLCLERAEKEAYFPPKRLFPSKETIKLAVEKLKEKLDPPQPFTHKPSCPLLPELSKHFMERRYGVYCTCRK